MFVQKKCIWDRQTNSLFHKFRCDSNVWNHLICFISFAVDSPSREYICPHEFINTYYIYSINNTDCQFWATQCDSYEDFKLGKCPPDSSVVTDMGFYGENVYGLPEKTKFFFRVDENPPYCLKDGYEAQSNCD